MVGPGGRDDEPLLMLDEGTQLAFLRGEELSERVLIRRLPLLPLRSD